MWKLKSTRWKIINCPFHSVPGTIQSFTSWIYFNLHTYKQLIYICILLDTFPETWSCCDVACKVVSISFITMMVTLIIQCHWLTLTFSPYNRKKTFIHCVVEELTLITVDASPARETATCVLVNPILAETINTGARSAFVDVFER